MGRLRTNPNAIKIIGESPLLVKEPNKKYFSNSNPIYIEVGMGKGNFIIQNALQNPKINYIGVEKFATVILKAVKKVNRQEQKINNLLILNIDAKDLKEYFSKKIDKIYLNFSDPWPKKRHELKRLTSPVFRSIYRAILKNTGNIEFKTDNDGLYQYTLESLTKDKTTKIVYHTNDLYSEVNKKINLKNIPTEYETKFLQQGLKIKKIVWRFI